MLMCAKGSKMNAFFTFRQRHTTTMPLLSLLLLSSCKAIRKEEDDNDDHHFHLDSMFYIVYGCILCDVCVAVVSS